MRKLLTCSPLFLAMITFSSTAFEKIDQSLSAADISHVIIENQRGQVAIKGSEQNQVSVTGELDDRAKKFVFEKDGSTIRIKVVVRDGHDNEWGSNKQGSDLLITLPSTLKVSFNGVSANIDVENLKKSVDIKTVSGDIVARNLHEHIELNSISGDIESRQLSGKVYISTVSGEINDRNSTGRLSIQAVSGDIDSYSEANEVTVETVSGEVELKLATVEDLEVSTVSGEAEVSLTLAESGHVKMSSVSGDLDAHFNGDVSANFKLKTNAGGDIRNNITNDKPERGKYVRNAKLSFDTGGGKGSVRATTVSGTIKVSKR